MLRLAIYGVLAHFGIPLRTGAWSTAEVEADIHATATSREIGFARRVRRLTTKSEIWGQRPPRCGRGPACKPVTDGLNATATRGRTSPRDSSDRTCIVR
jgi:hypothetical protein